MVYFFFRNSIDVVFFRAFYRTFHHVNKNDLNAVVFKQSFLARQLELFIFNKRVLNPNNTIVNRSFANSFCVPPLLTVSRITLVPQKVQVNSSKATPFHDRRVAMEREHASYDGLGELWSFTYLSSPKPR